MGVRHGQPVEDLREAQKETNEKLTQLVEAVGKLVLDGEARDKELVQLRAELAKEKEERARERREVKERESAERAKSVLLLQEWNRGRRG